VFVVYAQRVGSDRLATFNKFAGINDWREEMRADGFDRQIACNAFVDSSTGNKVLLLAECAEESEANAIAQIANRTIRFARND
jgi:hypothetical protein